MKHIGIFLSDAPHGGGSFQYSLAMLEALASFDKDHYRTTAVFIHPAWEEKLSEFAVTPLRIPPGFWGRAIRKILRRLAAPPAIWRALAPKMLPGLRALAKGDFDLLVFPSQQPYAKYFSTPGLTSVHDLMHRYEGRFAEVSAGGEYKRREAQFSAICRFSAGVLVDSETGKQQVVESYATSPDKVHVLPFVPPTYIQGPTPAGFDSRYSLPEKYLFYPAQFWEHKNHKNLLRAMASLREEHPDMRLVFVGSKKNGYYSTLALARELEIEDRTTFAGFVPDEDMAEFYRRARALVMPTFFGPTNIPPLEAQALGCPVAISGTYGMPEQSGDAALYFDPARVPEIARAMARLWSDDTLCQDLAQKGLLRSQQWTQTHFSGRVREIIQTVLQ